MNLLILERGTVWSALSFQARHPGSNSSCRCQGVSVKQGTNQADNDPLMDGLSPDGAWALSFAGAQLNRKQDSWLSITVSGRTLLAFERPSGSSVPRLKWKGISFVFWGFFAHHPALEADASCWVKFAEVQLFTLFSNCASSPYSAITPWFLSVYMFTFTKSSIAFTGRVTEIK